ncbi:riboflavin synthase [Candidatus Uhrbacteria bacterium]|nr:riboflavin synthase [Candidatus Uhrbacteria bacterium]
MFSGIVRAKGEIANINDFGIARQFIVRAPQSVLLRLRPKDSVLLGGICFTVHTKDEQTFQVEAMPQTLRLTTAASWKQGDSINIEMSLRMGDTIGGHFVYGHVDEVGTVKKCAREGNALIATIQASPAVIKQVFPRASVAIDGVSLTVVSVEGDQFTVSLIPDTVEATTLGTLGSGSRVNVETDMMIKYAQQHLQTHKE